MTTTQRTEEELDRRLEAVKDVDSKSILDEVVGLLNILTVRHIIGEKDSEKKTFPAWFYKDLEAIDFKANTMQSALDNPEEDE